MPWQKYNVQKDYSTTTPKQGICITFANEVLPHQAFLTSPSQACVILWSSLRKEHLIWIKQIYWIYLSKMFQLTVILVAFWLRSPMLESKFRHLLTVWWWHEALPSLRFGFLLRRTGSGAWRVGSASTLSQRTWVWLSHTPATPGRSDISGLQSHLCMHIYNN